MKKKIPGHAIQITSLSTSMEYINEAFCKIITTKYTPGTHDLLIKGADINYQDANGDCPLLLAIRHDMAEQVDILLNNQANVNLSNKQGETPLHVCIQKGNADLVRALIKANVGINMKISPLSHACMTNNHEIAKLLLDAGADPNIADRHGETPLHYASGHKYSKMVKLLLSHPKINVNLTDNMGDTALHKAACQGHLKLMTLLLDMGADPNIPANDGMTVLMTANKYGKKKVVALLLQCGRTNIDLQTAAGQTALMFAAKKGNAKCVKMLILRGANHSVADKAGVIAVTHGRLNAAVVDVFANIHRITVVADDLSRKTSFTVVKGGHALFRQWNSEIGVWSEEMVLDPHIAWSVEIVDNTPMLYHKYPVYDDCRIHFSSIVMPDGSVRKRENLYHVSSFE